MTNTAQPESFPNCRECGASCGCPRLSARPLCDDCDEARIAAQANFEDYMAECSPEQRARLEWMEGP